MNFEYESDKYGRACLKEAQKSKGQIGFGAVLVKNGKIIGRGWNRHSISKERKLHSHVDYAIHAEQACIIEALENKVDITGCEIYVLGIVLLGHAKGKLTTRTKRVFVCKKCPPSVLIPYNISVNIPYISGWVKLNPEDAMKTATELCGKGYWEKFAK